MPCRLLWSPLTVAAILAFAIPPVSTQSLALKIIAVSPNGELCQLSEADEIRIVFSEPMVPLGVIPDGKPPSWLHITPAAAGNLHWSGTKTLIFSPDSAKPLPNATRFTVRIDAGALSLSGRSLAEPYDFTFTTPTVELLSVQWYRKTGRFDSPGMLVLKFNQRVRAEDVLAHARVSFTPHDWTPPALPPQARDRLSRTDPKGLRQFDAKVASVGSITSSSARVDVGAAISWDESRFPRAHDQVVLETMTAAAPDAWWLSLVAVGRGTHGPPLAPGFSRDPGVFVEGPDRVRPETAR